MLGPELQAHPGYAFNLVPVTLWDLTCAAALPGRRAVLARSHPVAATRGVARYARLALGKPVRSYRPFRLLVRVLARAERAGGSVALVGMDGGLLRSLEERLLKTYPQLRITGRFKGKLSASQSRSLAVALRKLQPDVVVFGPAIRHAPRWVAAHRGMLGGSTCLWVPDLAASLRDNSGRRSRYLLSVGFARVGLLPLYFLLCVNGSITAFLRLLTAGRWPR